MGFPVSVERNYNVLPITDILPVNLWLGPVSSAWQAGSLREGKARNCDVEDGVHLRLSLMKNAQLRLPLYANI